jgi:mRNA-degrading endonuclease RelE of RelBE toxin-antitoxin system
MKYDVELSKEVEEFLYFLDKKSRRICKKNLSKLEDNPYPGRGSGDKEKIIVMGKERYRLHIGRIYTSFYIINEKQKIVRVVEILSIEQAHKKYGY